jgi:catechol 2,3-dioxygenase-like lactoylglutathione lyase family enzyme
MAVRVGETAPPRCGASNRTEVEMSSTDASSENAAGTPPVSAGEFRLEVVVLAVADVDRAKRFYEGLGWRLDADFSPTEDFRIVQLTPPGSLCSIQFGIGVSSATPGSAQSLYLAVADIEAAREELIARGAQVSEVFHEGAPGARFRESDHASGPSPDPYSSFATFSDPDGNGWLLQEITTRLPGR